MEAIEKTELENAQDVINLETKRVSELCANEITEILKKYSLSLVVSGQFNGDEIKTGISLVPAKQ